MRGRRPGKTGGVFAGIHRGFFRAENDADGRGSFAAVEPSMPDRLRVCLRSCEGEPCDIALGLGLLNSQEAQGYLDAAA
jgi:hypothetical protein